MTEIAKGTEPLVQELPTGGYLAFDPTGSPKPSETGYIYFVNWKDYEIGAIQGDNSVEHGEKINMLIKKLKPLYVAWEYSQFFKVRRVNKNMLELIYINGIIPYVCRVNNIPPKNTHRIVNLEADRTLNSDKMVGLEYKQVQGKKGRPKNTFYFHGKPISNHQADALAIFCVLWTRILKKPWPWNK